MTPYNRARNFPACRPANPGDCAQCTLSYDCQSRADNGPAIHWPIVGLAIAGGLMLLLQVL